MRSLQYKRNPHPRATKVTAAGQMLILGLFFIMLIFIVIAFMIRYRVLEHNAKYIDTALSSSLLAGATIDIAEYANNENIVVSNDSYEKFVSCLKHNMGLSDSFEIDKNYLSGVVKVERYITYSVIYTTTGYYIRETQIINGSTTVINHAEGEVIRVETTDGEKIVTEASVFGEISFEFKSSGEFSWSPNSGGKQRYKLSRLVTIKRK